MPYVTSTVGQHLTHATDVGLVHHRWAAEQALTLAALLGEDVPLVRLSPLEAFGGRFEALRRGSVGLDLGHFIHLTAFMQRIAHRQTVQDAIAAEAS